ncbi:MAG TPA: Fe-S-containing protein [Symbiobacteriaceae bacterium]|jgi:FTR1 family protein
MAEALIITLREGIEAALIIGIILAFLNRTGRNEQQRFVFYGLAVGVVASLGVAYLFKSINFDPENEILEGSLYFVSALMVGSLIWWMQRSGKGLKQEIEGRLAQAGAGSTLGLVLLTAFMVFREGVEMVLFLAAAALDNPSATTASVLLAWLGGFLGISLSVLLGVFLARGVVQVNLRKFFGATSIVLGVLVVRLVISGIHEFAERGLVPMTAWLMRIFGYVVRDAIVDGITMLVVTVPVFFVLFSARSESKGTAAASGAERRKALAVVARDKAWRAAMIACSVAVVVLLGWNTVATAMRPVFDPPVLNLAADSQSVVDQHALHIYMGNIADHSMHKFSHNHEGHMVRLLVVPGAEKPIGAMDACPICGAAGYVWDGNQLICKNCNAPISLDSIGMEGGCNPIPVHATVDGDKLVIPMEDIARSAGVF